MGKITFGARTYQPNEVDERIDNRIAAINNEQAQREAAAKEFAAQLAEEERKIAENAPFTGPDLSALEPTHAAPHDAAPTDDTLARAVAASGGYAPGNTPAGAGAADFEYTGKAEPNGKAVRRSGGPAGTASSGAGANSSGGGSAGPSAEPETDIHRPSGWFADENSDPPPSRTSGAE